MPDDRYRIRDRYPDLDLAVVHPGGTRVLGVLLSMNDREAVHPLESLCRCICSPCRSRTC